MVQNIRFFIPTVYKLRNSCENRFVSGRNRLTYQYEATKNTAVESKSITVNRTVTPVGGSNVQRPALS